MIKLEIELGNFDKLAKKLGIARDQLHFRLWQAVAKTAYNVEALAKRMAPRNLAMYPIKDPSRRVTGNLRRSITAVDKTTGGNVIEWRVGSNIRYAPVQEFGNKPGSNRHMAPKLFLARGYKSGVSKLPDRLMKIVGEAL